MAESHDLCPQTGIDADCLAGRRDRPSRQCFLRASQFDKSNLPAPLKLAGDESVVRINTVELTLSERSLITEPLNLLRSNVRPNRGARNLIIPFCVPATTLPNVPIRIDKT